MICRDLSILTPFSLIFLEQRNLLLHLLKISFFVSRLFLWMLLFLNRSTKFYTSCLLLLILLPLNLLWFFSSIDLEVKAFCLDESKLCIPSCSFSPSR
mmetsp:Transcript_18170/g.17301  ORF Transcript_18170/g.17301 Transcript_18170/m.17301 type:complete len:98 (+) Transcript_18170:1379-1672(+)